MSKNTYMCIQRSLPRNESASASKPSPAQMEAMYAKFNAWKEKYQDSIVDMGGKLKAGGKIVGAQSVTDGPFVEAKELIGGYMIVSADTMEEAIEIAQASPGVGMPGATIEVREIHRP